MLRKKGDISSIITFLVVVFFLAVSFIVVAFANNELKAVITDTELNGTQVATDAATQMDNITNKTINNSFGAIVAFLIIGMIISSMLVRIHPVFLFIYIIITAVAVFAAVPLANTYEKIISNDTFASVAANQTIITWIMEHIVLVLIGTAAISMIILFSKLGSQVGLQGSDV